MDSLGHQLSIGQKALWFLYQLAPEPSVYNVAKGQIRRYPRAAKEAASVLAVYELPTMEDEPVRRLAEGLASSWAASARVYWRNELATSSTRFRSVRKSIRVTHSSVCSIAEEVTCESCTLAALAEAAPPY